MAVPRHYDIFSWKTHDVDVDLSLMIRTTNGYVFHCYIDPSEFVDSPMIREKYFKWLALLRSGEPDMDDVYEDDALEWILQSFEPLICQLAPRPDSSILNSSATLKDYFSPVGEYYCTLRVMKDRIEAYCRDDERYKVSTPILKMDTASLNNLNQWTMDYSLEEVKINYNKPEARLIQTPAKVVVDGHDGNPTTCFFKEFKSSIWPGDERNEVTTHQKIIEAQIPESDAHICKLYGLAREGNAVFGMLFTWIDISGTLSASRVEVSSPQVRERWANQISASIDALHKHSIVWGDAKAGNVLIDEKGDAWVIDFGGGYTIGWVDANKAGTFEGDRQGLKKIMNLLLN